ncbi:hypothetical protein Dehly_1493 [Dehalogenimonas lykanthroporepellens BL-DC-9]|jgi:hypothetical protein|nr:hypothetical protein Dehly_1493 [Dehalogenimonas lykanthroporepellens BL-DC-9]
MDKSRKARNFGLLLMLFASVLQVFAGLSISKLSYGFLTDPVYGFIIVSPMLFGLWTAMRLPFIGGVFAAIINGPLIFAAWVGMMGDPWLLNRSFSQATFLNMAIYYAGLAWHVYVYRKAPG